LVLCSADYAAEALLDECEVAPGLFAGDLAVVAQIEDMQDPQVDLPGLAVE
jgi:hypothetical protein